MTSKQSKSTKPASSMEELLARSSSKVVGFKKSQRISAKFVGVFGKSAIFDLGGKSEGVVAGDFFEETRGFISTLKPGDEVDAVVMEPETREGTVALSLRHSASNFVWDRFENAKESGEIFSVMVRGASPSGLQVEVSGISGFIPNSQIGKKLAKSLGDELIGKKVQTRVLEVDKARRRVLFSEKAVSEEGSIKLINKALSVIKEGEVYSGEVTTVSPFGAFVKLNVKAGKDTVEVEGLVHVSEISWEKVNDTKEVIKSGEKVKVKVLGLRDGKLSLSIRHAMKDPWEEVAKKYKADTKIKGKVARKSDFGVFVTLEPGVEGLLHITKIPPATKLSVGDEVNCYVEEVDTKSKKISLGLVLTSKPVGYK